MGCADGWDTRERLECLPPGPGRFLHFPCLWDLPSAPGYVVWYDAAWRAIVGSVLDIWSEPSRHPEEAWTGITPFGPSCARYAYLLHATTHEDVLVTVQQRMPVAWIVDFGQPWSES
jgi:hypothetical protein